MITVCINSIVTIGTASAASSHNFNVINAIAKNRDSAIFPVIDISFIGSSFFDISAIFLIIAAINIGPIYAGITTP